ncbi:DsbA family protein [Rodentibacter sp. Ppn85]|uniref:DsbA family protein n=1 Tax=Rodentibacter sp. Ppn85 TaxID=1908525 RepID=UPI00098599AF|nr:DsbA family protein [Rodentibacter sp. Ppn85]OOF64159.1 disulfide bond formation protein DsbA [Rodentibacter sp. Ppn85]
MLTISLFTDPMMGLSYESEPFLRKVETHFGGQVQCRPVMSGLVRNVYDFVDPNDLAISPEYAIAQYLPRLAQIYNAEQSISGMPIQITELALFSTERPSSVPLNLAYKAVELIAPDKAAAFLYRLRFATIAEQRPTTEFNEILRVVEQVGIDKTHFERRYHSDTAQAALEHDFRSKKSLNIDRLPAYLFEYKGKQQLVKGVLDDQALFAIITKLTDGKLQPQAPAISQSAVKKLIEKHKLISPIEIQYAFGLPTIDDLMPYLIPLLENATIKRIEVKGGWFLSSA